MTNCTNAQIKENRDNLIKALESGEYSKLKARIRAIRDVMLQHKPSQSRPVPELSKVARSFEELEGYDNV